MKISMNALRQVAVIIATIATIAVGVLANAIPINATTTSEIAGEFDVAFTPASYVLVIWNVIYLGLAAYAVHQGMAAQRNDARLRSIDLPYLVAAIANIGWIVAAHHQRYICSVVAITVLLAALLTIYLQLDIGRSNPRPARRWAVHVVFSIYLGWVTLATITNIGAMLESLAWTRAGRSPATWFAIAVVTVLIAAALVTWTRADAVYLAVTLWTFIGLGVRHTGTPSLSIVAWSGAAVSLALFALALVRRARGQPRFGQ